MKSTTIPSEKTVIKTLINNVGFCVEMGMTKLTDQAKEDYLRGCYEKDDLLRSYNKVNTVKSNS